MIRIAQAASSETHSAYGTPPNQLRTPGKLDGELNIIPFYSSGWQAVLRAKDPAVREKIASIAEKLVKHGEIYGYGQQLSGPYARTGAFDELYKMADPDPEKVTRPVNVDCSSMMGLCVYFAGVYEPQLRSMNTTTEPNLLMMTDAFVWLDDKELLESAAGCARGDIYWRSGHTMCVLDSDETPLVEPVIVANCSACHLRTGPGKDYKHILYLHPGDIVYKISTADNGWIQVKYGDTYGYMSPKYYEELDKGIATGNVWMREDAGKNNPEIIVIPCGADVWLTGETKKAIVTPWYDTIYAGRRGWASSKYITEV